MNFIVKWMNNSIFESIFAVFDDKPPFLSILDTFWPIFGHFSYLPIVSFVHTDQIADNIYLKIMWNAKMSLKSDLVSKEGPTKLAALQGDTNLLLELLEDGAPFIVDSVRSQSDRILYWICLIGLDLFLSLCFSKINCL